MASTVQPSNHDRALFHVQLEPVSARAIPVSAGIDWFCVVALIASTSIIRADRKSIFRVAVL
jgi:hypothetical protein